MLALGDVTTIAAIGFDAATLVVETNSLERAAAVRARLEAVLGGAIGIGERSETSGAELLAGARQAPILAHVPSLEAEAMVAELKQRHYASWADHPLPALDGKTPRHAVKTAGGRKQVALLLD